MTVIKLDHTHVEAIKPLFLHKKYMGIDLNDPAFIITDSSFNEITYNIFCNNYLSNLKNFHAYGYLKDGIVNALISFYESIDEPSWYYTIYRSLGNNNLLRYVLDKVIEHNESNGRLKFYSLTHQRHTRLLRRFHWSKYNDERYGYFDEYYVPAKAKVYYTNAWELLYNRLLVPETSIVRCNFLKQEYRKSLPQGGNL